MPKNDAQASAMEPVFISLHSFAQSHALKYGIELMGGFKHSQESVKHYADTEENWHKLIAAYSKKEVK